MLKLKEKDLSGLESMCRISCYHIENKCSTTHKSRTSEKGGGLHTSGFINTLEHVICMIYTLIVYMFILY